MDKRPLYLKDSLLNDLIFFYLHPRKDIQNACIKMFIQIGFHLNSQIPPNLCGDFNKFPDFFVQTFRIVVDSWKITMLLLYIFGDDWSIFMILGSNEQLQQHLEYTLLKCNCHSWWISKIRSGREDTLEDCYAIKLCFKLGKMLQKRMECFRLLFDHLAWIEHQFLSGIRDSRKAGTL